ncbi:MAG: nucleoside deaminase [Chitinispirillia bacterium]|nr:nucleoside deaminase [Chitinispirillia bacterium]MCL2242790.1 nucleoside deaminase [Chitinispirillia bacterium]
MEPKSILIELPGWMREPLALATGIFATREGRMDFVIDLARQNIEEGTGGPFAAAVFDMETGRLIAAGVNLVTNVGLSIAHAEIVALMQAQSILGSFDLGAKNMPRCELVTTTAPCAMCLGAVPWSGVRALVCGARDEDARAAGFDEGSKREDWTEELEARGIEVVRDIRRSDAAAVLRDYADGGGIVYNGRCVEQVK